MKKKDGLKDLFKSIVLNDGDILSSKQKSKCPYGFFDREGVFDCEINTKLDCDDCKFGLGRKNPFAKRNKG